MKRTQIPVGLIVVTVLLFTLFTCPFSFAATNQNNPHRSEIQVRTGHSRNPVTTAVTTTEKNILDKNDAVTASPTKESTAGKENIIAAAKPASVSSLLGSSSSSSNTQGASVQAEPFTGSANVPIPINVPPGRAGVQPNLVLAYNSNAPYGLAGFGWDLDLGAIERSTKDGTPQYNSSDKFLLSQGGGSQNLIYDSVVGFYRTEVESSFARIDNIGNYWVMTDKKGTKYYFGLTANAQQADPADAAKVFKWALEKVEDLQGNEMKISYVQSSSFIYPSVIEYTGNSKMGLSPFARVEIRYRADDVTHASFQSGFQVRQTSIISSIVSFVNGQEIFHYDLTYLKSDAAPRNLLKSVQQIAPSGKSPASLNPVQFQYQTNQSTTPVYELASSFDTASQGNNIWNAQLSGGFDRGNSDFGPVANFNVDSWQYFSQFSGSWGNGSWSSDSKARLKFSSNHDCANIFAAYVYVSAPKVLNVPYISSGTIGVYLNGDYSQSVGQTWNLRQGYNLVVITAYHQSGGFDFDLNYSLADNVNFVDSGAAFTPQIVGDFNGDGKLDAAVYSANAATIEVSISNGSGFLPKQVWISNFNSNSGTLMTGDFTGDGRSDIVIFDPSNGNWRVLFSTGTSFTDQGTWISSFGVRGSTDSSGASPGVGDFNGDGISDIYYYKINNNGFYIAYFAVNRNQHFEPVSGHLNVGKISADSSLYSGDFNADGLGDIIVFSRAEGKWKPVFNTGLINNSINWISYLFSGSFIWAANKNVILSDFNDDGTTDVAYYDDATNSVAINYFSAGRTYATSSKTLNSPVPSGLIQIQPADYNGDGLKDLAIYNEAGDLRVFLSNEKYPDLLVSMDNGVGGVSQLQYSSSSNFANNVLPFNVKVLTGQTVSDQLSHTYETRYSYSNGLWDSVYREFNGFGVVKVIDVEGSYTQTIFLQDHFFKGRPSESSSYDSSHRLYVKTVNQWQSQDLVTSGGLLSKFVYLSRTDNFLYDGAPAPKRTAQEFIYNESVPYGDPTSVINYGEVDVTTGNDTGTDKITTQLQYVHNSASWLLGLPKFVVTNDMNGKIINKTWFYYDNATDNNATPSLGLLTKKVNWLGDGPDITNPQTQYSYDAYGNLQTITDPKGNITQTTYDPTYHMFPIATENAVQQKSFIKYFGVDGVALTNGTQSGLWGQVWSTTDINNQNSYAGYDAFGRQLVSIGPLGSSSKPNVQMAYEQFSTYKKITAKTLVDHGGSQTIDTVSYYDGLGRLIQIKTVSGQSGQWIVSGQTEYNSRGLPVKKYLPYPTVKDLNTMDPIDPSKPHTTIAYDAMGRVTRTTNPDGTHADVVYQGLITRVIDENGHVQESEVDVLGRLIQKREYTGSYDGRDSRYGGAVALYATTKYEYDNQGNLAKVIDAKSNETRMGYDQFGRKTSMDDPDMGHWSYEYDANGNMTRQTDAKGQVINFEYDKVNRLVRKYDATGVAINVNYTYDQNPNSKGRLDRAQYGSDRTDFSYDAIGREIKSVKTINGQLYQVGRNYNALNSLLNLENPDGAKLVYTYNAAGQITGVRQEGSYPDLGDVNADGRVTLSDASLALRFSLGSTTLTTDQIRRADVNLNGSVTLSDASLLLRRALNKITAFPGQRDPVTFVSDVQYNANGQITVIKMGNGTTTDYTYYPQNFRLKRLRTVNAQAAPLQDLNYTYDSVGNILSITDNVNTADQTFVYDSLNRLVKATGQKYGTKNYAYDTIGNITSKDGITYVYSKVNAGPHAVTSLLDGTTFSYDRNGNMVTKQKGTEAWRYEYDIENRLKRVLKNNVEVSRFEYDGDGGRTRKIAGGVTTTYVGSLFETSGSRSTKFIFLGSTRVASVTNGKVLYYHADHLGGTNVLTGADGVRKELIEYDPFGVESTHEKYGSSEEVAWYYFTGKPKDDETGLYYYGARYYDPKLGRFITPDPIVQSPGNPQTLNRYTYCNNNPINLIDPTGHSWKKFWKSFAGAFVGAAITVLTAGAGAPLWAAGMAGGFFGGAVSGGLEGGWKGALYGGLIGGAMGGLAGWGGGIAQAQGMGGWYAGGLIVAGAGAAGATDSWDSFAGGLTGGFLGYQVGNGIDSFYRDGISNENPTSGIRGGTDSNSNENWEVLGIGTSQQDAAAHAAQNQTSVFYVKSRGLLADFVRASMEKFGTSLAQRQFAGYLSGANGKFIYAHSEGTLLLASAARALKVNGTMLAKTHLDWNAPAIFKSTAANLSRSIGASFDYHLNWSDPIGVLTTFNPAQSAIYGGVGIATFATSHGTKYYRNAIY